jgi:hypothetical protein
MLCVGSADHPGRVAPAGGFRSREPFDPVGDPEPFEFGEAMADPIELRLRARQRQCAALMACLADRMLGGEGGDLGDGCVHRLLHPRGGGVAVAGGDRVEAHRQQRRAPSAVAPTGAEADVLTVDHDDPQRRIALQQVIRGPQPGETCSHDRHIDIDVTVEGRAGDSLVLRKGVGPQRSHGAP